MPSGRGEGFTEPIPNVGRVSVRRFDGRIDQDVPSDDQGKSDKDHAAASLVLRPPPIIPFAHAQSWNRLKKEPMM